MRKIDFCIYKNKGADQLCSKADQCLRFRYMYKDSTIPNPFLPDSKLLAFSYDCATFLCHTLAKTQKTTQGSYYRSAII